MSNDGSASWERVNPIIRNNIEGKKTENFVQMYISGSLGIWNTSQCYQNTISIYTERLLQNKPVGVSNQVNSKHPFNLKATYTKLENINERNVTWGKINDDLIESNRMLLHTQMVIFGFIQPHIQNICNVVWFGSILVLFIRSWRCKCDSLNKTPRRNEHVSIAIRLLFR